jgi:type I restriction enzyme S subunit
MKQVIVEEGDIIVGMDGDFRVYWWDDKKALLNQRMTRITSEDYHDRRYLYYLLPIALEYIQEITASTTVKHLSTNEIRKLKVPSMPHEEREAIVEFLDQETKDIDELIEKKEKLIKLIEERRKAVIKNAVIKGLDSDVDLKESGVDWLGEVPEHWDVPRIRFVARMESGHTPSKSEDEYWDGDIPWVSLADSGWMREHDYISETDKTISEAGLANSSAHILPPETMVFTRDATVGLCAITTREMAVSQHIIGWICEDNLLPEYLLNVTKAMDQELDRLTMGATISTVGMEDIKKLKMPLPPIEEQEDIVEYLNEELEKFDESIEKIREGIERLKEYRTALITEAVTGQIDVRGEV